jgi:hypothetical protein
MLFKALQLYNVHVAQCLQLNSWWVDSTSDTSNVQEL